MFQLVTDTACDLSFDYLKQKKIGVVGFTVTVDGVEYRTDKEGEMTPEHLVELIREGKEPTTSQVNVGEFVEFFKTYAILGKPLLYLAFSSGLSGTYQSALQAVEILKEESPTLQITVIDTKAASNGMAIFIERAVELRDKGMTLSEVASEMERMVPRVYSWVMVDDLYHLERGGRISKASAVVGTLLNIKPIIDVDENGKLRQVGKTRGRTKALKQLVNRTIEGFDEALKQKLFICYSGEVETAEQVKEMILVNSAVEEVELNPLGPTIATHTGDGTIAIFSIGKEDRK